MPVVFKLRLTDI